MDFQNELLGPGHVQHVVGKKRPHQHGQDKPRPYGTSD